jgi:hypothetical protein
MPPTIMTTTDTPRTDASCPHCGARKLDYTNYICGTTYSIESRGNLCLEREKSQKLEARLTSLENDNFNLANALSKAEADVERLTKVIESL